MQYLLNSEEYAALLAKNHESDKAFNAKLQSLCTRVANELPILFWNRTEKSPWGCTITKEADGAEWYCDECVAQDLCPYPHKAFSK